MSPNRRARNYCLLGNSEIRMPLRQRAAIRTLSRSWAEIAPDGFPYPPFKWDEEQRARPRTELDAIYAHLYGLTREELDYYSGDLLYCEEEGYGEVWGL